MISTGLGSSVVVLTQNKETKEAFKQKIKDKNLYINKNPFEQKKIIKKEILYI